MTPTRINAATGAAKETSGYKRAAPGVRVGWVAGFWNPTARGLRRRHPRRSDRGARGREDSAEERNPAKEKQPFPWDHEGSLVRKETQIQIVRQRDAQGDAHRDSRQRDERELDEERPQDHRFAEAEGSESTRLLSSLTDVAHRDDAEARDADDQAERQLRLQDGEH